MNHETTAPREPGAFLRAARYLDAALSIRLRAAKACKGSGKASEAVEFAESALLRLREQVQKVQKVQPDVPVGWGLLANRALRLQMPRYLRKFYLDRPTLTALAVHCLINECLRNPIYASSTSHIKKEHKGCSLTPVVEAGVGRRRIA